MKFLIFLMTALCGMSVYAETVTLAQLVRRFVARSPELQAAKSRFESQNIAVKEAAGNFLPQVSAQARAFDQQNVFNIGQGPLTIHQKNYATEVVVNQPLFMGGANINNYRVKSSERDIAEVDYFIQKNQIVVQFVRSFSDYLYAQEATDILRKSAKTYRNFLEITQRKRRSGAALPYELDQARADHLSYEAKVRTAEQRQESAERYLRALLNLDPEFPLETTWPKVAMPSDISTQPKVSMRPEWRKAQAEMKRAEIEKFLVVSKDLPSVHLQATYGYQSDKWDDLGEDGSEIHSVGVVLNVPLFSGLTGVQKWRGAERRRESAERIFRAVDRDTNVEQLNAVQRLKAAIYNLTSSQSAAESAQRAVVSGLSNFKAGRISLFQVVQLQSAYERSELARIDAYRETLLAEGVWANIMGKDLETYYK